MHVLHLRSPWRAIVATAGIVTATVVMTTVIVILTVVVVIAIAPKACAKVLPSLGGTQRALGCRAVCIRVGCARIYEDFEVCGAVLFGRFVSFSLSLFSPAPSVTTAFALGLNGECHVFGCCDRVIEFNDHGVDCSDQGSGSNDHDVGANDHGAGFNDHGHDRARCV